MDLLAKLKERRAYHNGACIALTGVIVDLEAQQEGQLADLERAHRAVTAALRRAIEEAPYADQVEVRSE